MRVFLGDTPVRRAMRVGRRLWPLWLVVAGLCIPSPCAHEPKEIVVTLPFDGALLSIEID